MIRFIKIEEEKMGKSSEFRKAFLFEGVGIEYKKFLELFNKEQFNDLMMYSKIISSELNIDIWAYVNNELNNEHDDEFLEWVLIYTCDYIIHKTYIEKDIKPDIFAGYSMGLITAMACAEAISFETGLRLLRNIYTYPTKIKRKEEAMASIIGFDYDEITEIIEEVNLEEFVQIASENSDYCIVISGVKNAVYKIIEIAEERGAIKTIILNSTYAFHSNYASLGIDLMYDFVKGMKISKAKVPIISVFTQKVMREEEELRNELLVNMASSMKWKDTILKLGEIGVNNFIEVSLNDSLTKISKVINLENDFMTYKEFIDYKND